jgi:hypothetical protein
MNGEGLFTRMGRSVRLERRSSNKQVLLASVFLFVERESDKRAESSITLTNTYITLFLFLLFTNMSSHS